MNAILLTLITLFVPGAWLQSLTAEQRYSVPEWANRVMERGDFQKLYEMDAHLNPFCQRADFDGDGKLDFAVFVRERSSGKIGIAFIHRSDGKMYIVGAGKPGVHGDDYSWIDAWIVFDKGVVLSPGMSWRNVRSSGRQRSVHRLKVRKVARVIAQPSAG